MALVLRIARGLLPLVALVALPVDAQDSQFDTQPTTTTDPVPTASVCEARTINHITHSLPQLCLTGTWRDVIYTQEGATVASATQPTASESGHGEDGASGPPSDAEQRPTATQTKAQDTGASTAETSNDAEASPFMSFEDWKEMMLKRTGQDPQDLRSRKAAGGQSHERIPPDMSRFVLGDDEEISLDFDNYLEKPEPLPTDLSEDEVSRDQQGEASVYEDGRDFSHRSKDAGKTCKERFSYSSFDAGATVLKTGRATKNAKAILVENKDSYMLLECAVDSKYVIVELSDDILIDTVVLANFEFFSSMIRHFRLSVSDRYPVKMDKWRDLGTFEARNSRDIQAFLVENPQIWAKYVRIEFLSHYGNEYYCPVSLLRVHGSRMLDSWKDPPRDEEPSIDDPETEGIEAEASSSDDLNHSPAEHHFSPDNYTLEFTPWDKSFRELSGLFQGTCHIDDLASKETWQVRSNMTEDSTNHSDQTRENEQRVESPIAEAEIKGPASGQGNSTSVSSTTSPVSGSAVTDSRSSPKPNVTPTNITVAGDTTGESMASTTKNPSPVPPVQKHRSTGTNSAAAATPTVQEGFFNAVTKRLNNVESNLTLSLQYLEDSSRHLQEAMQRAEQKQLSKVTVFLENLNQTVMAELRGMRDQYEQIWQSTIIALESQKEQSDRDIVALSSRLNLLADEVVFQKRMAIVQAMLLLCCLFLVIFSRGVPIPYLAPLLEPSGSGGHHPITNHNNLRSGNESFCPNSDGTSLVATGGSRLRDDLVNMLPLRDDANTEDFGDKAHFAGEEIESFEINQDEPDALHMHPSPPPTPNLQPASLIESAPGFELQSSARRLQHYQQTQSRKPLPALPEHPSPDQSSSS